MGLQSWHIGSLALGALALAGAAAAQSADGAHFVSAAELAAKVTKLTDGIGNAPVSTGPNGVVLIVRRDRDGEVEVHDKLSDELIARKGQASILVGGRVDGNHPTTPGEHRGGKITGGKVYALAPGDVIWIPAGMPHQMLVTKGKSFTYMAIKFPK